MSIPTNSSISFTSDDQRAYSQASHFITFTDELLDRDGRIRGFADITTFMDNYFNPFESGLSRTPAKSHKNLNYCTMLAA